MKFSITLISLILFLNTFVFAITDTQAEIGGKAILGAALGIQLLIVGAVIYFIRFLWRKITNKPEKSNDNVNNSSPSLEKAVDNHSKEIASTVKPSINEYKQRHAISQIIEENQDVDLVDKNIDGTINKIDNVIDNTINQVKTSKYIVKGFKIFIILFSIAVLLVIVINVADSAYSKYRHNKWISSEEYKILKNKCDSGNKNACIDLILGEYR